MALTVPDGDLIDPFGGQGDLAARILRTPLAPDVSLSDDPLRMLRAARFVAGYTLAPEPDIETAIVALRDRLGIVSRERIRDELDKLLAVPDPVPGLLLLRRTELLAEFIPELSGADDASFDLVRRIDGLARRRVALFLPIADRSQAVARARALKYSAREIDSIGAMLHAVDALRARRGRSAERAAVGAGRGHRCRRRARGRRGDANTDGSLAARGARSAGGPRGHPRARTRTRR